MAAELFPRELTRKQYGLRLIGLFAFMMLGVGLWVAALISAPVFLGWVIVGWVYAGFGLAVPRLRNAGQATWWAVFFFIPRLNIVAAIVLLIIRERSHGPSLQERQRQTREHMRERLRDAEPEQAPKPDAREETI